MKRIVALPLALAALLAVTSVSADTLNTQTGKNIGISLSSYKYQEPGYMLLQGSKLGLDWHGVHVLQGRQYLRGDVRMAFGTADYDGSGSSSGKPDWYLEARGMIGHDWSIGDTVISPYFGLGYRYLFNDMRGVSCAGNTCYWGYRRESNYIYMPVGFTHRMALRGSGRLVSEIEYDRFISGKQVSMLSDGGFGNSDVSNTQNSGYGVKFSVMYEQDGWSAGPYGNYWKIGKSDWVPLYQNGSPVYDNLGRQLGGVEPANNTREFGIKFSQRF